MKRGKEADEEQRKADETQHKQAGDEKQRKLAEEKQRNMDEEEELRRLTEENNTEEEHPKKDCTQKKGKGGRHQTQKLDGGGTEHQSSKTQQNSDWKQPIEEWTQENSQEEDMPDSAGGAQEWRKYRQANN